MENDKLQWKTILSFISLVFIASLLTTGLPFLYKKLGKIAGSTLIQVPSITKEGIENPQADILSNSLLLKSVSIFDEVVETPDFVTDPQKLRDYLEEKSVKLTIIGQIDEAYLYIKTGIIDITRESVYFFVVDSYSKQGHLVSSENLVQSNTDFLFDLSKVPLSQLPFPLEPKAEIVNVLDEFLNQNISYKSSREYFIGGFVSTTKFPNGIQKMEIRYSCKTFYCTITANN